MWLTFDFANGILSKEIDQLRIIVIGKCITIILCNAFIEGSSLDLQ